MSLQVTYNGVTIDPLLSWQEDVTKIMAMAGRAVRGYRHIIRIKGFLQATNVAGKLADIDSLLLRLRESNQDLQITQDGTDFREVLAADVQGTGPWSEYSIPGTDDPQKVGFDTPFEFRLEFITDPPTATGGTVSDTFTDTFAFDKQECRTFTRRGNLSTQSGTSATGKFDGTDPVNSLPAGAVWERESREFSVDDDDQNMDYSWVYREQHFTNPTSAKDIDITITSTYREGLEIWNASGRLGWEIGTSPDVTEVQTILDNVADWPGGAGKVTSETIDTNDRENTVTFAIELENARGFGQVLEYEERVQTITEQAVKDWHSNSQQGKDKRQVLHNPAVTIIHTWRVRRKGSIPSPVDPIVDKNNAAGSIIKKDFSSPRVTFATDGSIASGELSGVYTIRPLNITPPNQFRPSVPPSTTNPLQGTKPTRGIEG